MGKNSWKRHLVVSPNSDIYQQAVSEVEKQQKQADKKLNSSTGSGAWTFIDNLKNSFLSAFENIGPAILNGLSTALDWLGEIAIYLVNALTGEGDDVDTQVEKAYGEKKPEIAEALKKVGKSLEKLFIETIPKLIGAAIGTVIAMAPTWFGNLFDGIHKAGEKVAKDAEKENGGTEDVEKAENIYGSATGILDFVKDFIKQITDILSDDIIGAIGVIVAITLLFKQLKEIFSFARETEAVADVVKWSAFAIAFAAIYALVSSLSSLYQEGNPEKLERVETFLDKFSGILTTVAVIVGLISGVKITGNIKDGITAITDFKEWKEKLKEGVKDDDDDDDDDGSSGLLGSFYGFLGKVLGGAGTFIGAGFGSAAVSTAITALSDAVSELIIDIDDIFDAFLPFMDKLKENEQNIEDAIKIIGRFGKIFVELFYTFNSVYYHFYQDASVYSDITAGKGKAKENDAPSIIKAFVEDLDLRIMSYDSAIQMISHMFDMVRSLDMDPKDVNAKLDILDKLFNLQDGPVQRFFSGFFNTIRIAFRNSNLYNETYITEDWQSGVFKLVELLSISLSTFSNMVGSLDESGVEKLNTVFDMLERMVTAIVNGTDSAKITQDKLSQAFFGNANLSKLGSELRHFGERIVYFYQAVKDITGFEDEKTVKETEEKVKSIIEVASGFALIASYSILNFADYNSIGQLIQNLPLLASTIVTFYTEMDNALNKLGPEDPAAIGLERLQSVNLIIDTFGKVMQALNTMHDILIGSVTWSFGDWFDQIFAGIDEDPSGEYYNNLQARVAQLIMLIDSALASVINTEEFKKTYEDNGKIIARELFKGISEAFETDPELKPTITPVLNLDTAKQQLIDFFGTGTIEDFNLSEMVKATMGANSQTDDERVKASWLATQFTELKGSVDNIVANSATPQDLVNAFTSVKIVTDTGVLAGSMINHIDDMLGEKIWIILRGGTP